jgi:hypothetical protein
VYRVIRPCDVHQVLDALRSRGFLADDAGTAEAALAQDVTATATAAAD